MAEESETVNQTPKGELRNHVLWKQTRVNEKVESKEFERRLSPLGERCQSCSDS